MNSSALNIFRFFFIFIFLVFNTTFSQELPPIITYETDVYKAGNQNWMLDQDDQKFMYAANHSGLLEYNGAKWTLYTAPNETTIRSVQVVNQKIYTGCYMDFGYWERTTNGKLTYTSLASDVKNRILDDEQFWNIIHYDNWIVFQSLHQLFVYDVTTHNFEVISPEGGLLKVFHLGPSVYFQTMNKGLFEIVNGKPVLIAEEDVLKRTKIVNLYKSKTGLLIHTQLEGLFQIEENVVKPIVSVMASKNVYNSIRLSNGNFALGTVSDGVFIINQNGEVLLHINQSNGLSNNTVLSLFEDVNNNLWIGLDNGINCINLDSTVESYIDDSGMLGTIYASVLYHDILYLGTNQGLFWKSYTDENSVFQLINATKGQVWNLKVIDDTLFCGHDAGTFVIEGEKATRIFSDSGTWTFTQIEGNEKLLLQGNYYGISVLTKRNGNWEFSHKIKGFNYSSRFLEAIGNTLYVSHEYKGLFQINVNADYTDVIDFELLEEPQKGKNASITSFRNSILYASKQGVFKLNTTNHLFEKDTLISEVIAKDGYTSGRLIVDPTDKLWLFTKNHINFFTHSNFDAQLHHHSVPIPYVLANAMSGYENVSYIAADTPQYLIGTVNGYYLFNPEDVVTKEYEIYFTNIQKYQRNNTLQNVSLVTPNPFNYKENNVNFSFSIPQYSKYANAEYQHKLVGFNEEWSNYTLETAASFKNLPPGDYIFKVRGKVGDSTTDNELSYAFTIQPPWFATNVAMLVYLILLMLIVWVINSVYKSYYTKQRLKLLEENRREIELHKLESEQKLMKTKTEILEKDIESKNRELAASTLNLIKKNEMLSAIKNDLKKLDSSKNVKSVISTINANINEEDTWNKFSEVFNNADKDFLKKVKSLHPSLTPNDLRLCAYLRLNLSSKEIAPLLNISVRSVEIKRYRLRKKMNLDHENGLVEYILAI